MSLLLDALKRAEEAKRAKLAVDSSSPVPSAPMADQRAIPVSAPDAAPLVPASDAENSAIKRAVPTELNIEDYKEVITPNTRSRSPVVGTPPPPKTQPHVELTLENLADTKPIASPGLQAAVRTPNITVSQVAVKPDAIGAEVAQSRDTARNIFVAKQATGRDADSRKTWLLPVIAAVLILAGAGGWYVWNEINRMGPPGAGIIATRPAAVALAPAQPATGQPGAKPLANEATMPGSPVEPPLPPLLPPPAAEAPLPIPTPNSSRVSLSGPPLSERETLTNSLKIAPALKEVPISLQLAKSISPLAVNTDLVEAYAALKSADYPRARTLYAKLLQVEPLNIDAQLGMATVFARQRDAAAAASHYRQVLVIDPRNGTALAGLLAVSDSRSPALEVELRTLVGRNPETSSLRFTLGNLYASERRWVEAQQAYFDAFRLESDNADYAYNLAVSLDQLRQAKLAKDYYQKALVLAPKAGAQFDAAAVVRRIRELSGDTGNN